jgi:ResB-like family
MATATKKFPPASSEEPRGRERPISLSLFDRFARMVDAIYRFLSSLKLAVISITSLAATLAYATFFESWHGAGAAQQYIYRSPGFAILLAFLGMNILCAALIRYPWKKRQTGFVVTHVGLLTLLAGSYYSVRTADEGQVGMLEGDVKGELVRIEDPVIRIWEIDPHTRERTREFALPFRPGPFEWGPARPRPASLPERVLSLVSLGNLGSWSSAEEVLSKPGDPFQFVVNEHLPASVPAFAHVADPDGAPMVRLGLQFKGPGMPAAQDAFRSERDHWFATEKKFHRVVRSQPPAFLAFSYVDRRELVEDFLKPPASTGTTGVARLRYADRSGKTRAFDWVLDDQQGKSIALPESDLTVTLAEATEFPTSTGGLDQVLGEDAIPIAVFKIQSGKDEPITHMALANLPMVPNVIPPADAKAKAPPRPLASINYFVPPTLDPKINGRFGQIEVLAGPDDALYYRVFGRGKGQIGELRAAGPLAKDKPIVAFGGNANMPMTITFQVDQYLPSGIEKSIYEPVVLPKGQMGNGIAACRALMTVDGQTEEVWLSRSENLDQPPPRTVAFRDSVYQVVYDVDRKPLGFELKLDDFDTGFEPGTEQATHFESKVRLTDKSAGIKDQPHTIWMNHPLDHRGYTFYQSNYIRVRDPDTGQYTGQFQSVFQVATNPGRSIIYGGCLLIVMGAFLQFYMRAGIFTDGGKRERDRAAIAARKKAELGMKTEDL